MDWKQRCELIPDGVSTMSKMPSRYVEGFHPKEWDGCYGAYCTIGDKSYIDYTLGLGAVILGYGDNRLRQKMIAAYDRGTPMSCPHDSEGRLAETICEIVPSAEMVRFVNTGTEACLAAVKIARAATGRERLFCCGYHGWAPFYAAQSPHNAGCTKAEKEQIASFKYNDVKSLLALLDTGEMPAAVIMEPVVFQPPEKGFLRSVRDFCNKVGAVLIFDEVVTGLRMPKLTAQKTYNVKPDLTTMGKCVTNGVIPMGIVCGKRSLMKEIAGGCFVSSTFGGNPLACEIALETIRIVRDMNVPALIAEYSAMMVAEFASIADNLNLSRSAKLAGIPCRTFFEFPTEAHKSLFWQECLRNGVWFGYAQFVSQAHGRAELDRTCVAMRQAMDVLSKHWDNPAKMLEGKAAEATFRLTVGK